MQIKNPLMVIKKSGTPSTGEFLVQVIDYDGTILKSANLNTGDTFTLPASPTHEGLTFQEWSSPVTITNNMVTVGDSDITIGATYKTTSGLTELDITLTNKSGLTVSLNLWSHGDIDWGDGTTSTTTTHTYTELGNYTIKIAGLTKLLQYILNQSNTTNNRGYILTAVRLAETIKIFDDYVFYKCNSLKYITIPSGVTSIGNYTFQYCYSLTSVVIPSGVTSISDSAFQYCYSLTSIVIPSGVTSIGNTAFQNCYSLTSIVIPSSVTSIGNTAFQNCKALKSITIPSGVTSISDSAFSLCSVLKSVTIPSGVTSIGKYAFRSCYLIRQYDFSTFTKVPTLANTNSFSEINENCIIKVPNALFESWKTATNWATYADYMVGV